MNRKIDPVALALIIAGGLFILDAFVFNQGIIALVTIPVIIIMLLITLIFKKYRAKYKKRLVVIGIYLVMSVMIIASIRVNNKIAENRGEMLIEHCENYKAKYGSYPGALSDLVPEYIEKIPRAKYALQYNDFKYTANQNKHLLMYVAFPPHGRVYYCFEEGEWEQMD